MAFFFLQKSLDTISLSVKGENGAVTTYNDLKQKQTNKQANKQTNKNNNKRQKQKQTNKQQQKTTTTNNKKNDLSFSLSSSTQRKKTGIPQNTLINKHTDGWVSVSVHLWRTVWLHAAKPQARCKRVGPPFCARHLYPSMLVFKSVSSSNGHTVGSFSRSWCYFGPPLSSTSLMWNKICRSTIKIVEAEGFLTWAGKVRVTGSKSYLYMMARSDT